MVKKPFRLALFLVIFFAFFGVFTPQTYAQSVPVGQTGSWNLVFQDEFSGNSVDLTKWRPNWLGPSDTTITKPINSSEKSCYDPAQVKLINGELQLTAGARTCVSNNGTFNYASGMVESNGKFNFTYGYAEARIWTPAGTGVWPAFWTDGQDWPADGEIDILEAYGDNESTFHYHYAGCSGDCNPGGSVQISGATAGWHTYAANWEPGKITWYYDGNQVFQQTTNVISVPHYLILNLGLKGNTPTVPSTMRVDYVRVWKKAAATSTPTKTPTPTLTPVVTVTPMPAFPGAQGFGSTTVGGRGGKVVQVTNLNDSGPGSLRQALEVETGPRTVVFTTGGTIELTKQIKLEGEAASYVTIAGQTAPGGGIQLKNYGIEVNNGVHDVVIRFIRSRVGQRADYNFIDDNDSLQVWGGSAPVYNIVLDHISAEWGLDENMSVWENAHDVTYQYNLIAEDSLDGQDHHAAKGMLIGADNLNKLPNNISIHHNIFAHNSDRNPRVAYASTDFRNNIIYNWGGNNSTMFGNYEETSTNAPTNVNVVNNLWKKGPSSSASQTNALWLSKNAKIFVQGNWGMGCPTGCTQNEWSIGAKFETSPFPAADEATFRVMQPFSYPVVSTTATQNLMSLLTPVAGAVVPQRDSTDTRIISELGSGTGATGIHGSFPVLAAGTPPIDSDQDGMPQSWEQSHNLNDNDATDAKKVSPSGYTWIEVYINSLVANTTPNVINACSADIDQGGFVDLSDYSLLVADFFKTQPTRPRSDIDRSGFVDLADYSLLVKFFFQACP